jgi:glycosyltransferase involved in cell wall biosynthesis
VKRPYFFLFERRVFNRAAAIHCTSNDELQQMAGLHLRARKFVVPNAVSAAQPAAPSAERLKELCPTLRPEQKTVLYLGRITWIKKLDALLEAFIQIERTFPDWCLILAGTLEDSRIVERLRSSAAEAGISERLMMPGTVLGDAKTAMFNRADIFAQPSLHENFGASVAEALGYGIPCVVSSGVALAPDVLEAGAGLVCESTPAALAKCLQQLMGDQELRQKCGRQARQLAAKYQPENVAAQLDVEYQLCAQTTQTNC